MKTGGITFAVMAKAPVAGVAKTRLAPALGAAGAAALAARLLEHTLTQACAAAGPQAVLLAAAPDLDHAAFRTAAGQGVRLVAQGEGDLGQRMQRVFEAAFDSAARVVMLGTDAPALDAAMLRHAAAQLDAFDAVFVPALDGGYALVGLRRPAPLLFERMPWSTAEVMARTRERLREAGLAWTELPPVHDIDTPDDLVHLPQGWRQQILQGSGHAADPCR